MKNDSLDRLRLLQFTRTVAASIAAFWIGGAGAQAVYLGTWFTDTWYNPAEAGWGVTATHSEPVIFLTFFIYRGDTNPYWLTATVTRGPDVTGSAVYSGDLHETHGPAFGGTFNPGAVTYRKVGQAAFVSGDGIVAVLSYTVDGVQVTKALTRQTLRNLDFSGSYAGSVLYTTANCTSPALNGRTVVDYGPMTITQSGTSLNIVARGSLATCTISGTFLQLGQWGNADGSHTCSDGSGGPLTVFAMQRTVAGFTAAFAGENQQCEIEGTMSGIVAPY